MNNKEYWQSLYEDFPDSDGNTYEGCGKRYIYAYNAFMHNRDNTYKCHKCPKEEEANYYGKHPCGQEKCWVTIHCNSGYGN